MAVHGCSSSHQDLVYWCATHPCTTMDQHILAVITSAAALYLVLSLLIGRQLKLPLAIACFFALNMAGRAPWLHNLVSKYKARAWALNRLPEGNSEFEALRNVLKEEVLLAIGSLSAYRKNLAGFTSRRRNLFKRMSFRQQELCRKAGYIKKLDRIDAAFDANQRIFSEIAALASETYGVYPGSNSFGTAQNTLSTNYRVVEILGHFHRDWSAGFEEQLRILAYVKHQLDQLVPPSEAHRACIVLPGLGVGRMAHEVALHRNYAAVHAVEFSGLMHMCHRYIYQKQQNANASLYPFVHNCLNFYSEDAQMQVSTVGDFDQPPNVNLHLQDFRHFSLPKNRFRYVVVVSVFFVDTAENPLDYFDKITELASSGSQVGGWINAGPLKYGSAAQAELTAEEIGKIRKSLGWKDLDETNSAAADDLVGYITNKESMWQGYYGLAMWASRKV